MPASACFSRRANWTTERQGMHSNCCQLQLHFLKINVILNSSSLENHTDKHAKCFQNVGYVFETAAAKTSKCRTKLEHEFSNNQMLASMYDVAHNLQISLDSNQNAPIVMRNSI